MQVNIVVVAVELVGTVAVAPLRILRIVAVVGDVVEDEVEGEVEGLVVVGRPECFVQITYVEELVALHHNH